MHDHLAKDVGSPGDKRLAIEGAALRQLLKRGGDDITWIDTSIQLADIMTKEMSYDFLQKVISSNRYQLKVTQEADDAKRKKREGRTARKEAKKAAKTVEGKTTADVDNQNTANDDKVSTMDDDAEGDDDHNG